MSLPTPPDPPPAAEHHARFQWRRYVAIGLVVASAVTGMGAVLGTWAYRTLFNTERFMGVVSPTIEDPLFYVKVSEYASREVLTALDLEARFTERLSTIDEVLAGLVVEAIEPGELLDWLLAQIDLPTFASLAPTLAAEVEERIDTVIRGVLTSDPVTNQFPVLVERAHQGVTALVLSEPSDIPNVYVEGDEVRFNLLPYIGHAMGLVANEIEELLPDVTLPPLISDRVDLALAEFREALGRNLPDDFGQLRLMSTEQLDTVQGGASILRNVIWVWVALAIVLTVATFVVSTDRLRTFFHLAVAFVIAFIVGGFILSVFEGVVINALGEGDGELISSFLGDVFARLRWVVFIALLIGGAAGIGSHLGRHLGWKPPTPADGPGEGWTEIDTRD